MDTPESPSQTSLSPEEGEDEKSLPDSELLDSPDEEEDRLISDSEVVQEEDNEDMVDDDDDDDDDEVLGRGSECEEQREEEDEVVPDFVSDLEDEEPLGESEGGGQEDGTIMLVEGDEDCPPSEQLDRETEEEERVIDTPQSPDSELPTTFIGEKDGEKRSGGFQKETAGRSNAAELEDEDDKTKAEEQEKNERMRAEVRRRAIAASEMKDDSASVARELDEHELDYDEEVPEEPGIPLQEDDEDEEDAKAEGDAESEDKSSKKREKKIILSPKDREGKRIDGSTGPGRIRRNSSKDKKKDEDDGEIDEGEIDVRASSCWSHDILWCSIFYKHSGGDSGVFL